MVRLHGKVGAFLLPTQGNLGSLPQFMHIQSKVIKKWYNQSGRVCDLPVVA